MRDISCISGPNHLINCLVLDRHNESDFVVPGRQAESDFIVLDRHDE